MTGPTAHCAEMPRTGPGAGPTEPGEVPAGERTYRPPGQPYRYASPDHLDDLYVVAVWRYQRMFDDWGWHTVAWSRHGGDSRLIAKAWAENNHVQIWYRARPSERADLVADLPLPGPGAPAARDPGPPAGEAP